MNRTKRFITALVLALLTATTAGAQDAITGLTYNTAGGYYEISDAQDLVDLANYVNATENISTGKTFKQTQNIDMSSISNFTPIGEKGGSYSFAGTYDGQGYTISGLTVSKVRGRIGLFASVKGGTVRNVILLSPTVTATTTGNLDVSLGALIGTCDGSSNLVENCHVVNSTVSSSSTHSKNYVGAIIGNIFSSNATVTNCYYYGGNANAAYGNNPNGATVTNVCAAHLVTPADGVTIQTAMAPALGFTCDTDNNGTAENYWRSGAQLTLSHADREGYTFGGYTVNGTAIDGNTFTMPDENVTITTAITPDPAHFSVNDAGTEYTIHTATGWNVFCDMLESGESFSGKTVKLGTDIGTAENPVIRKAGSTGHEFTGTFDGQGKTLFVNITGTVQGTAPFCEIKGATIRNLVVAGSVAGKRHSAGLVGFARGDDASVENTIENCLVATDVSIKDDDRGYLGGIVGHGLQCKLTIRGCAFTGSLTSGSYYTGGLQGWSDGNTLILENDIFAPTSVSAANVGFHPIAIHNNNATTIATVSNVYYTIAPTCTTSTRIAAAGKAVRSVTAGTDVILYSPGPLNITNTYYNASGIRAYTTGGLYYNHDLYYGSGDRLSILLENTRDDEPLGYRYTYAFSGGTADEYEYSADYGETSYHLTMPDENVTISVNTAALRSTGQPVTVAYIKADGTTGEASAIALDGTETSLAAGWYFVGKDISYTATLTLGGDVNLILADGKTMNVTTTGYYARCINAPDGQSLHIYGQTEGTGVLNAQTQGEGDAVIKFLDGTLAIHGGNVEATLGGTPFFAYTIHIVRATAGDALVIDRGTLTATANKGTGIYIDGGDASINGGQVAATGTSSGIDIRDHSTIPGILTLSGGTLTASSFDTNSTWDYAGTLAIAPGLTYTDGTSLYDSATETATLAALGGKTLQPCLALADAADNTAAITDHAGQPLAVALSGRTLYKDGSWNTLCLPFAVDLTASGTLSGDNVQAMTLNTTTSNFADGTLTLNFTTATAIPAGTPFIIKWDKPSGYVAYTGTNAATCSDLVSPVFMGVTIDATKHDATVKDVLTFTGTYTPVSIADAAGDNTKLYLGAANTLYYPNAAMTIGTHRAYFQLLGDLTAGNPASGVRAFVLNFGDDGSAGDPARIHAIDAGEGARAPHGWYTLDGRHLDGQPTAKGLYIHGGKKVVIK